MMLCFGFNLQSLPSFLQDSISRMSLMMTPLILLFIGIAVKFKKTDLGMMLQLLFWRSGLAFLISSIIILLLPNTLSYVTILLVMVFPQSACSFWPFAHMTAIETLEKNKKGINTFDLDLALNILAFSLPFSTVIILVLCSGGEFFADVRISALIGFSFIAIALLPMIFSNKSAANEVFDLREVSEQI